MTLPVDSLTAHGFSSRTVAVWRRTLGKTLLPLQEKAIREFGFLHGNDLVVFAPTASGKTFLGELAALRHIEQGKAVAFLVPTRALAEEKAREFSERYRDLKLRIVCSTRERPENDRPVAEGRFDWLIAVYEKFSSHLVSHPNLLGRLGLIVADELQMLGDRERGPALDVLLTKVRLAPVPVQRLALSAVLSDAVRIAGWLDADLLRFDQRPVDLLEGVVDLETSRFHWRSFNSGTQGCDPLSAMFRISREGESTPAESERGKGFDPKENPRLPDSSDEFRRDSVIALSRWIAETRGEQVLVFVPTRWLSRGWAEEAAYHARLDPATEALAILERHEPNRGRDLLATCLQSGVAFHNADLPAALRRLVEHHFQTGSIRILFSTPTLAQGVNLVGRNVIQVPHMVGEDPWTGLPSVRNLSRERFRNQGGRAARTGAATTIGRSLVVASGEAEVERLMRLLVQGDLEDIHPPLEGADLSPAILDLLVGRAARSVDDLVAFFLETYTGQTLWAASRSSIRQKVVDSLKRLAAARLVALHEEDPIEVGGLAEAVAASGIFPETARLLVDWLTDGKESRRGDPTLSALLAAALSREMRPVLPPLLGPERSEPFVFDELHQRLSPEIFPSGHFLWDRLSRLTGYTTDDRRIAKLTLLLHDWIGDEETETIERRFGMLSGSIHSAGAQVAWILRSAASLAAALGIAETPEFLRRLADRTEPGIGEDGIALARLRVEGLGRGAIASLVREGIRTPGDLEGFPLERLETLLPPELCRSLMEAIGLNEELEADPPSEALSESVREEASPLTKEAAPPAPADEGSLGEDGVLLVIDEQSPGTVEWKGARLHLPPLPFRLLLALARKPGRGVTYRELVDRIWQGEAVVEQQQVNYHRGRIARALTPLMGGDAAKSLITTNSGQGLVLNLHPDQVRIV